MATHPLGKGTSNLQVNMPAEAKRTLGRLAFESGLPTGEFIRRLIERGLASQDPEASLRLQRIRERHRKQRLLV